MRKTILALAALAALAGAASSAQAIEPALICSDEGCEPSVIVTADDAEDMLGD